MATMTATSAVNTALQLLGVLDAGGSASATQLSDGLTYLQNMIDNANSDPSMAISSSRTTAALSSNVQTYTIGPAATINVSRPSKILGASVILSAGPTIPIRILEDAKEWTAIMDRDSNSYMIEYLWYDRGNTTGTIYLSPKPLGGTLELVYPAPITNFTDTTTPVEILPGYARWIRFGLAHELASTYDMPVPQSVVESYTQAMTTIQKLNNELLTPSPVTATLGATVQA
jgi:hypothetical protein